MRAAPRLAVTVFAVPAVGRILGSLFLLGFAVSKVLESMEYKERMRND